jgi:D-arabinose 1-dehydrogenase-like Zn-dependent alcohol dehydrogenase
VGSTADERQLDTQNGGRILRTRLLFTDGKGSFQETVWEKPGITANEIEVRAVMTGVCRSDIDMMNGLFGPLPINMHGHEGLGQVTAVGTDVSDVNVGDYVATRGEPAYADYYNVRDKEFVVVPSAEPKYILEPVACGINVVTQNRTALFERDGGRLAIIGSGFLAQIAYQTLTIQGFDYEIDVIGNHNQSVWPNLKQELSGQYDVIIDLSSRTDYLDGAHIANNAVIIMATEKHIDQNIGPLLWKAVTISFPSPRTPNFYQAMLSARDWIESGLLTVDNFWTQAYNRTTDWQNAFADGVNRPNGYSRGYIKWD